MKIKVITLVLFCIVFITACGAVTPYPVPATLLPRSTLILPTIAPLPSATSLPSIDIEDLTIYGPTELKPGDSATFVITYYDSSVKYPEAVDVEWSVEPKTGAQIDNKKGILSISNTTPHGSIYKVIANIENGKRLISTTVYIFTIEKNPFVSSWAEKAQLLCGSYESVPADVLNDLSIRELSFYADNTFSVTWIPFEYHRDYFGKYKYDLESGSLELYSFDGNYVPEGIDGEGSFSFNQDGNLVIKDIWLGSPEGKTIPVNCGYAFSQQ